LKFQLIRYGRGFFGIATILPQAYWLKEHNCSEKQCKKSMDNEAYGQN
jgi:hypothetical protein